MSRFLHVLKPRPVVLCGPLASHLSTWNVTGYDWTHRRILVHCTDIEFSAGGIV